MKVLLVCSLLLISLLASVDGKDLASHKTKHIQPPNLAGVPIVVRGVQMIRQKLHEFARGPDEMPEVDEKKKQIPIVAAKTMEDPTMDLDPDQDTITLSYYIFGLLALGSCVVGSVFTYVLCRILGSKEEESSNY